MKFFVTTVTEVSPTFLQWAADLEIAENGDISIAVFSADHFFLLSPLATETRGARPISSARGAVAPNQRTIPTPGGTPAPSLLSRELRGHLGRLASAAVDFDRRAGTPFFAPLRHFQSNRCVFRASFSDETCAFRPQHLLAEDSPRFIVEGISRKGLYHTIYIFSFFLK